MFSFEVYNIEFEAALQSDYYAWLCRWYRPSFNLSTTIWFIRNKTFVKHSQQQFVTYSNRARRGAGCLRFVYDMWRVIYCFWLGDGLQFAVEAVFLYKISCLHEFSLYDWVRRDEQYLNILGQHCWLFERCYWSKKEPTCRTPRCQKFRFTAYPQCQDSQTMSRFNTCRV